MKRWIIAVLLAALPMVAAAQGVTSIDINGSTVEAEIEFVGGFAADLTISFGTVVGLTAASLGLSATTVSPLDPDLLDRMPDPSISIPTGFPVVLQIEPPLTSPLSFSDTATVELHTHNLTYTPNSPLRLFKAPLGGTFQDITAFNGMGSYRVGGSTGGFSEFMIAVDMRPINDVIDTKFALLQAAVDYAECDIPPTVMTSLQQSINSAWTNYSSGYLAEAAGDVGDFIDTVEANAGTTIMNVWRASRDIDNSAGTLIERAATLRFSLNLASSS